MKAVKQLNIIYLLPCILVSKLTEDCIFVLMRWYNETGGIIQNWATHLSSTPLPFSSAFKLWTASTSHSRSQRVLLPVRRRFPRHSSTPTPRKHINSVSSGRSCISKISLSNDAVVFFSCVVKCHAIMNTWRILPICTNFSFVGFPGH